MEDTAIPFFSSLTQPRAAPPLFPLQIVCFLNHPASLCISLRPNLFKNNMKRAASGSEISLLPFCSSGEDQEGLYGRGFHAIAEAMEDGGDEEEAYGGEGGGGAKKRRLSVEQVRALEKSFEVENKLEPERKVRLATELGLQPRQVAVWFQNRRARWKTKQLERDYADLQVSYDALRLDLDSLSREKELLLSQINGLKSKLAANEALSLSSAVKEEPAVSETAAAEPPAPIGKIDGASDSDSSAVVNDATAATDIENSPPLTAVSDILSATVAGGDLVVSGCSSTLLNPDSMPRFFYQHHEILKMEAEEEEEYLSERCGGFFADEQMAATLNWYYSDHWNQE